MGNYHDNIYNIYKIYNIYEDNKLKIPGVTQPVFAISFMGYKPTSFHEELIPFHASWARCVDQIFKGQGRVYP